MKPRLRLLAAALFCLLPAMLPAGAQAADPAPAASSAESAKLAALLDQYFEESLLLNPILATSIGDPRYNDRFEVTISPEWRARAEKLDRDYLARIQTIDPGKLQGQDLLSYEIFKTARERDIEGYRFPSYLLPLNQFYSAPNFFAQLGSGQGIQPFKTVKDYEDFLKRADGFVAWTDQAIINMREGVAKGYTQPRILMERVLPQLQAQIVDKPEDSLFWGPVRNMPADFSQADRERLTAAYSAMISTKSPARLRPRRVPAEVPHQRRSRRAPGRQGLVCLQHQGHHYDAAVARRDPRDRPRRGGSHPR